MSSLGLPNVREQRVDLVVDTQEARFFGWTELRVAAPAAIGGGTAGGGTASLGLHCFGLNVQSVQVDGTEATFEMTPPVREDLPEGAVSAAAGVSQRQLAAVAESAFYLYERQLQRERQPELTIQLPATGMQQQQQQQHGGGGRVGAKMKELVVRVEYSGGGDGGAGLHFWGHYASTDNQVRRASAWVPCVDVPSACVRFHLDITCRAEETAVGPGQLMSQAWADSGRQWRTFQYSVPFSCAPSQVGFAVGNFRVVAKTPAPCKGPAAANTHQPHLDLLQLQQQQQMAKGNGQQEEQRHLTSFASAEPPPELSVAAMLAVPPLVTSDDPPAAQEAAAGADGLARSAHFLSLVFTLFEDLLGGKCPLPGMQQVFLPPELQLSEGQALAGLQLLGVQHLIQPRAIEQSIAARCFIARTLARQWFGVLLRAASPLDEWLVEGLSGWLEEQAVRKYMGKNELAYRRWRDRQSVFLADNGEAPPLAARGLSVPSPWGPLYGTERLDPSRLWSTKATAVVAMLEKRAGEELFRKHVATVVAGGIAALLAEQAASGVGSSGEQPGATPRKPPAMAAGAAAGSTPAGTPQKDGGASGAVVGSRFIDTMTFLNDLGRAGSFRKEMGPFAARWVFGRGVPRISGALLYHSTIPGLELALKQTGPESAWRAAHVAERAAAAEGSNAGIIKAVVREGEPPQTIDHPVHVGSLAFVLAELRVTPVVEKKQPGRRPRKRKELEGGGDQPSEEARAALAAVATPDEPVLWVRLDPAAELLCDIRLMQPERMLARQLLHSRDVAAQAEAVQRLAEQRISSHLPFHAGMEALRRTLHDRSQFYHIRCDAAMALAGLRDEMGQPVGLPLLLEFYKSQYFVPGEEDVPRSIAIADPSEYYVAQAVATAASLCREPDGSTPVDSLLFLSTCLEAYSSVSDAPFSDYGLVAALCAALGNLRFEGFGDTLLTLLEKFLERDTVLVSPGNAVGCACLAAMAALCSNGTCSEEEQERVALTLRRVRESSGLSVALRHSAMAAGLALAAARAGPAAAIQVAVAAAEAATAGRQAASRLLLPSHSTPAFLLEETAALTAAAVEAAKAAASSAAAIASMFAEQPAEGPNGAADAGQLSVPLQLLQRLAALLSQGAACRVRHLAFVVLQLLAVQPPTLYRPPPNESEEDAAAYLTAAAAAPAPSMGVTHPAGVSAGTAPVAPKFKVLLPGVARGMAVSGGGPALSGGEPASSDARALSFGAVEQAVPAAAQGQVYSPVAAAVQEGPFGAAPADGEEASSRQLQGAPAVELAHVPSMLASSLQVFHPAMAAPAQPVSTEQPAAPPSAAPTASIVRLRLAQTGAAAAPAQPQAPPPSQQPWQPQPHAQPDFPVLPPAASITPGQHGAPGWPPPIAPWGHDAAAQAAPFMPVPPAAHPPVQPTAQPAKHTFKLKLKRS